MAGYRELVSSMGDRKFGSLSDFRVVGVIIVIRELLSHRDSLGKDGGAFDYEIRRDLLELTKYPKLMAHCSFQDTLDPSLPLGFDVDVVRHDIETLYNEFGGRDFWEYSDFLRERRDAEKANDAAEATVENAESED